MMSLLMIALVFGVAMENAMSADPTFDPGCSFFGGQCVYSIKLGHKDQCDKPQTTTPVAAPSSGCCDELSTKYSQLKDDMDKLRIKVDVMTTMVTDSSKNVSQLDEELKKALIARDDIVMVLNRKETELNSTKAELAKVMADAGQEIQNLRDNLNHLQNSYATCQAALSGVDKSVITTSTSIDPQSDDYSMTYYDFNTPNSDFTFSKTSYGGIQMQLLHSGSSTSTGPRVEHTWGINKGSYLGISGSDIADKISYSRTTTVQAETRPFPPANAYCIMFWYYMEGTDVKTLTTNIKINGGTGYPVWTKTGPTGSHKWELAQIDLDSEYTQNQFQIDFTMSSDAYYSYSSGRHILKNQYGDIAIDDLYIFNTTCSNIPRHPKTHSYYGSNMTTSFYTFHFTPMTWTQAYDVCRRESPWTALVSIESSAEQSALINIIKSNPAYNIVGAKGFYTSGSDADVEHRFVWTNSGVQRTITFDYWHAGQPNNVAGNQDCLLMEYPNDNFRWGDVDCDTKHPFICEVMVPGKVTN